MFLHSKQPKKKSCIDAGVAVTIGTLRIKPCFETPQIIRHGAIKISFLVETFPLVLADGTRLSQRFLIGRSSEILELSGHVWLRGIIRILLPQDLQRKIKSARRWQINIFVSAKRVLVRELAPFRIVLHPFPLAIMAKQFPRISETLIALKGRNKRKHFVCAGVCSKNDFSNSVLMVRVAFWHGDLRAAGDRIVARILASSCNQDQRIFIKKIECDTELGD